MARVLRVENGRVLQPVDLNKENAGQVPAAKEVAKLKEWLSSQELRVLTPGKKGPSDSEDDAQFERLLDMVLGKAVPQLQALTETTLSSLREQVVTVREDMVRFDDTQDTMEAKQTEQEARQQLLRVDMLSQVASLQTRIAAIEKTTAAGAASATVALAAPAAAPAVAAAAAHLPAAQQDKDKELAALRLELRCLKAELARIDTLRDVVDSNNRSMDILCQHYTSLQTSVEALEQAAAQAPPPPAVEAPVSVDNLKELLAQQHHALEASQERKHQSLQEELARQFASMELFDLLSRRVETLEAGAAEAAEAAEAPSPPRSPSKETLRQRIELLQYSVDALEQRLDSQRGLVGRVSQADVLWAQGEARDRKLAALQDQTDKLMRLRGDLVAELDALQRRVHAIEEAAAEAEGAAEAEAGVADEGGDDTAADTAATLARLESQLAAQTALVCELGGAGDWALDAAAAVESRLGAQLAALEARLRASEGALGRRRWWHLASMLLVGCLAFAVGAHRVPSRAAAPTAAPKPAPGKPTHAGEEPSPTKA